MNFKASNFILTKILYQLPSYACDDYVINETQSKCILRVLEQFQNNQTLIRPSKRKDTQIEVGLSPVSFQLLFDILLLRLV